MCAVVILLSCLGAFMGNFLALSLSSAQLFCAAACCYAVVASRAAFRIVTFGAEGTADRVASEVMTNALCLCSVKAEREREREGVHFIPHFLKMVHNYRFRCWIECTLHELQETAGKIRHPIQVQITSVTVTL